MLYLLFFGSGASSLIYEIFWVRVFANVFGNTIYSASIVTAVFMLGLGIGGYVAGAWADRRYASRPESMLRVFGSFELGIGALGLVISALLPHLGDVSALVSSYARGADGWYVLSSGSYAARTGIALVLLTPITLLMGGTLTLLIRHLVRSGADLPASPKPRGGEGGPGPRIGLLYGVNTLGAAVGCFLTDFALVPSYGLRATQMIAVALNLMTAAGAFAIKSQVPNPTPQIPKNLRIPNPESRIPVMLTGATLVLTGFAAMGMEILWFRHFSILLGEFRAVFSLLLAIILLGIGTGSLAGGYVQRRTSRPAQILMVAQGTFAAATLLGLAMADARPISDASLSYAIRHVGTSVSGVGQAFAELWFNAKPILLVVGLPALLMGFSFPLANAVIQRAESPVGRRAGILYLSNTAGAVCGSLAAGFLLLPTLGIQKSATVLTMAGAIAAVPLYFARIVAAPAIRLRAQQSAAVSGRARVHGE